MVWGFTSTDAALKTHLKVLKWENCQKWTKIKYKCEKSLAEISRFAALMILSCSRDNNFAHTLTKPVKMMCYN